VGKITLVLLCAFVAFLPFEMMAYFPSFASGGKMFGMVLAAAAIVAFLMGHRIRMLSWPMMIRVVLSLFSALSLAWTLDAEDTRAVLPRVALLLVFILIVWEFAITYQDHMWILRSLLIGILVPLAMAMAGITESSHSDFDADRIGGGGQDLNYLAYMYSVVILFSVYLATNSLPLDRYCRWVYWSVAVVCAIGALATGSRGGMVCLLAAGIFAMLLAGVSGGRIMIRMARYLIVPLIVLVLARYIVPQGALSRVTLSEGSSAALEDDPRWGIWKRGLIVFMDHPLFGVGAGAYARATAIGGERAGPAHNTAISVLVELGVVGVALYVTFIVMLFRAAWRLPRREKLLWTGVLAVALLESMSCGSQIDKLTWFLYTMVLVQAAASEKLRPRKGVPPNGGRSAPAVRGPMQPRPGAV
jgi:O-antigen ligase